MRLAAAALLVAAAVAGSRGESDGSGDGDLLDDNHSRVVTITQTGTGFQWSMASDTVGVVQAGQDSFPTLIVYVAASGLL